MTPPHLKLNMNTFGSAIGGTINGGVGNNPFAESGTNFINCIFNGGNFWDAMGQSAAGLGVQAAEMAINSVFSAVGGGITSSISLAAEKAKVKSEGLQLSELLKSAGVMAVATVAPGILAGVCLAEAAAEEGSTKSSQD